MAENDQIDPGAVQAELEQARQKNADYEKLLLDPNYLAYLTKGDSSRQELVKAATAADPAKQIDFDQMSNKDLVEYMLYTMHGMINQTVVPVARETELQSVKTQVKEAAANHPDFWEYKEAMIDIGRRHPTMSAEEAYALAKGTGRRRPPKEAPRVESPGGGGSTSKATPTKGFEEKFKAAFVASGLGKREG